MSLMSLCPFFENMYHLLVKGAGFALLGDFGEEVVALVVDEDERGEVLDLDFPDSLHAKFGIFEKLDFLDAVLGEDGCGATD